MLFPTTSLPFPTQLSYGAGRKSQVRKICYTVPMVKKIVFIVISILILAGIVTVWRVHQNRLNHVNDFFSCADAGYPLQESFPARCTTPNGQTFTEPVKQPANANDIIKITSPAPNSTVTRPVIVTGQARGSWFFEGTFPVKIIDKDGDIVSTSFAETSSNWMTNEFVPFTAQLELDGKIKGPITLIIEQDNSSGLPERAQAIKIPLTVK